jgi:hypothetical protein
MVGSIAAEKRLVMSGWRGAFAPCLLAAGTQMLLVACAYVGVATDAPAKPSVAGPVEVRVEKCVDRTETKGRDLGAQATKAFEEKLRATKEFIVKDDARFRLGCDVTSFVEGSAIKRWILPGWGATVGQVSAMLTDSATGEIVLIVRGNATLASGGLYTIGADTYIVPSAVDDVVNRLRAWALGESPEAASEPGGGVDRRPRQ